MLASLYSWLVRPKYPVNGMSTPFRLLMPAEHPDNCSPPLGIEALRRVATPLI